MEDVIDLSNRFCIIGAGPSGLAAIKNFQAAGIPCDCYEQQDDLGGNWYYGSPHSSVYASTHLISSKRLTEFSDFRMPREYPHYPSHQQALDYLHDYAETFGLRAKIRFQHRVERITRCGDVWHVRLAGEPRSLVYRGVVVANGHHWDPCWPRWQGDFSGEIIHSHQYRDPRRLAGKRVLIVGAGNSGCDIAVESARHAKTTWLSLRRGYYFLPKYLFGAPLDRCGQTLRRWRLPRVIERWVARFCLAIAVGPPERYGLPQPDHGLFQSHPIVNSHLPQCVAHGLVQVCRDIDYLDGHHVVFQDGQCVEIDLIVCATGYRLTFPFLDDVDLGWNGAGPQLFLNSFHPQRENLFFCGLVQPNGGIWILSDLQSQLMAHYVRAQDENLVCAGWFQEIIANGLQRQRKAKNRFVDSHRHAIEVDYFAYRERLERLIAGFIRRGSPELRQPSPQRPMSTDNQVLGCP